MAISDLNNKRLPKTGTDNFHNLFACCLVVLCISLFEMFKLQTIGGNVFEGEIFAIDPVTKAIALQQQDGGFIVVNSHFIQQIHGDLSKLKAPDINALGLT